MLKVFKNLFFYPYIITLPSLAISCSTNNRIDNKIDLELKREYLNWYNSLSHSNWNKDSDGNFINYYCDSEQQAIALYANFRGWFFNEELHQNVEPTNKLVNIALDKNNKKEIRGNDYKLISSALQRAIMPRDIVVWHGVEYMEIEFWDQLQSYIIKCEDGSYNYENIVGKQIESYGFISTSLSKKEAFEYCDGKVFINLEMI